MLYVSPLKALAVDIERNLRAPLTGIGHAAHRLGLAEPDIRVAVRTGDTAAEERRKLASKPPDILITTPGVALPAAHLAGQGDPARGRDGHRGRGARRRGQQARRPPGAVPGAARRPAGAPTAVAAQRVGLSATVRPVEEVATFLGGTRAVTVVQPPSPKRIELQVVVPVEDMTELDTLPGRGAADDEEGPAGPGARSGRTSRSGCST